MCSPCQQGGAWLVHQGRPVGDKGDGEAGRDLTNSPTALKLGDPGQLVTSTRVSRSPWTTKPDNRDNTGSRSSHEVTSAREGQDQRGAQPGTGIPTAQFGQRVMGKGLSLNLAPKPMDRDPK